MLDILWEMVPKVVINPLGPAWLDFVRVSALPSLAFLILQAVQAAAKSFSCLLAPGR